MKKKGSALLVCILLVLVLPIVTVAFVICSTVAHEDNKSHTMKRAQASFSNLYKLMSSKSSSKKCVLGDGAENLLQTYKLNDRMCLTVAKGSVVEDFSSQKGAIVNAANEGCLGGGGVDGAITSAGGLNLHEDRLALPTVRGQIRCPTGEARLTGPGDYGSLRVPYVIHAVGPNYYMFDPDDAETPHSLLRSAYSGSMDCTRGTPIEQVAFSLLSAGVFRGTQSLATVLAIGVEAIRDWATDESNRSQSAVEDIVLFAYMDKEAQTLVDVCDKLLGGNPHIGPPPKEEEETVEDSMVESKKEEEENAEANVKEESKDAPKEGEDEKKEEQQTAVLEDKKAEDEIMTDTEEKETPGNAGNKEEL